MQLVARRRQADQVEVDAAQQRGLVGFGDGLELALGVLGGEEAIDRVLIPGRVGGDRRLDANGLAKRPVRSRIFLRLLVAGPFAPWSIQAFSRAICSAVSGLPSGGIRVDLVGVADALDEQALRRHSGLDRRARLCRPSR